MNDPMEGRLDRLRPSELSPALMQRLLAARPEPLIVHVSECDAKVVRGPWFSRVAWAAAAAAAVGILAVVLRPVTPEPAPRTFTAVESRSYLINANDLGVVTLGPDRPFRLVRCVWLDDDNYRSDDGRSSMRRANARAQIVPVALETY